MKTLVLGASGIIGQHLRLTQKLSDETLYVRRTADALHYGCDVTTRQLENLLATYGPDVIVNCAGESNVDAVERNPDAFEAVNVELPVILAAWCETNKRHLIQLSSQAVFGGDEAPYGVNAYREPVNEYGRQKKRTENLILNFSGVTIIRATFVLGVRLLDIGRPNPFEQILAGQAKQVSDRWFSPSFAVDVARCIWDEARRGPQNVAMHAGVPVRVSRYSIAKSLGMNPQPVTHYSFADLAPRPLDTTFADGAVHWMTFEEGLADCMARYGRKQEMAA